MHGFLQNEYISVNTITRKMTKGCIVLRELVKKSLSEQWNISLNLKIPLIIFSENGLSKYQITNTKLIYLLKLEILAQTTL